MSAALFHIAHFTPAPAVAGGVMIGCAAALLMAGIGRIAGISGILHGLAGGAADRGWRLSFVIGLLAGAGIYVGLWPGDLVARHGFSWPVLALAGLLVGAGTRLGSGCTSGHGVCGIARRSPRSLVATALFMAAGVVSAVVGRHMMGIGT